MASPDFGTIGLSLAGVGDFFTAVSIAMPLIIVVALIIVCIFLVAWLIKFKYDVTIYSQRSDGEVVKYKDRGAFRRNRKTGIERFALMKTFKAFVAPIPNEYIIREGRKDKVILFQTTGREFIPCTYANHTTFWKPEEIERDKEGNITKYKVTGETDKRFIVHTDFIKNWLSAEAREDEMRFSTQDFLSKYGVIILPMILVAAFVFTMHYSYEMWAQGLKAAQSAAASGGGGQIVSAVIPLWMSRLFRKQV